MLTFHAVEIEQDLFREHPLYVGNFFQLKRMWWRKRKQRQGLIISIAVAWYRLTRKNVLAPGFINEEIFITSLTKQVSDAKVILERFFEITRIGYNFGALNKSPTLISPKKLNQEMIDAIESIINVIHFRPGAPPIGEKYTQSLVEVDLTSELSVMSKLRTTGREDLIPAVTWLFQQDSPITFYFERAGALQERDKSIWPIRAIELWPGWLRTALFGTVIDIENSYCQFIVKQLEKKYEKRPHVLDMKYSDLLRFDRDKQNFREELRELLKLPPNDEGISVIKKLIMSLANGSNATPALMIGGSGRSEAVRIVRESSPDLLPSELKEIGERLAKITKQFKRAKRDLCIFLLNAEPSRANQRKIFQMYFKWERESRYAIWDAIGRTGLHLHDGLDGVISNKTSAELVSLIAQQTSLRVSVDKPIKIAPYGT
jgi:hypothetical protein